MALPISTAIGLGGAGIGTLFGFAQKLQANSLEKKNPLPLANIDENLAKNVALAEQMARVGLAQEAYDATIQQQNQNQANAFRTASRTGRGVNAASILRQSNEATGRLNVADANARTQNQRVAMQQGQVLAQERQRVWNWNKRDPYLRMSQRVASLRNAGNSNIFGGLGTAAQIGMNADDDGYLDSTATPQGTPLYSPTFTPKAGNYLGYTGGLKT